MTLEILKNNRQEVIEEITNTLGAEMVKEVMTQMVKMIGFNGIRSTTATAFVHEVISLLGIEKPQPKNTLWGAGCKYSTQSEYQRSCMGSKWN